MGLDQDLCVALAGMVVVSCACCLAGAWAGRRAGDQAAALVALGALAVVLGHGLWLGRGVWMARLMPVESVIVWGNVQGPAIGWVAGLAWARIRGKRRQRVALAGAVLLVAVWRLWQPFVGARPVMADGRWSDGACLQTSGSTCSPAAAATVFAARGVGASEREMAELCGTRRGGTSHLMLYRGMRLKAEDTGWDVTVLQGGVNRLREWPLPVVASVTLPGVGGHSVAIMALDGDGNVDVADPLNGRRWWSTDDLGRIWGGQAIGLVTRTD